MLMIERNHQGAWCSGRWEDGCAAKKGVWLPADTRTWSKVNRGARNLCSRCAGMQDIAARTPQRVRRDEGAHPFQFKHFLAQLMGGLFWHTQQILKLLKAHVSMDDFDLYAGLEPAWDAAAPASMAAPAGIPAPIAKALPAVDPSPPPTGVASSTATTAVLSFQDAELRRLRNLVQELEGQASHNKQLHEKAVTEVDSLKVQHKTLIHNISVLYRTAVTELERKNTEIQQLRSQLGSSIKQRPGPGTPRLPTPRAQPLALPPPPVPLTSISHLQEQLTPLQAPSNGGGGINRKRGADHELDDTSFSHKRRAAHVDRSCHGINSLEKGAQDKGRQDRSSQERGTPHGGGDGKCGQDMGSNKLQHVDGHARNDRQPCDFTGRVQTAHAGCNLAHKRLVEQRAQGSRQWPDRLTENMKKGNEEGEISSVSRAGGQRGGGHGEAKRRDEGGRGERPRDSGGHTVAGAGQEKDARLEGWRNRDSREPAKQTDGRSGIGQVGRSSSRDGGRGGEDRNGLRHERQGDERRRSQQSRDKNEWSGKLAGDDNGSGRVKVNGGHGQPPAGIRMPLKETTDHRNV